VAYILYWNVPDAFTVSFTGITGSARRLETRPRPDRGLIDTKRSSAFLRLAPSIRDSAARYRDIAQDGRLAERYPSLAPSRFTLQEGNRWADDKRVAMRLAYPSE